MLYEFIVKYLYMV